MKIPEELLPFLARAQSGEELISNCRAILFYIGDLLIEGASDAVYVIQSIDSQTDHIELAPTWPFPKPSPRVALTGQKNNDGLVASSVVSIMRPGSEGYEAEVRDIYACFETVFTESVMEILASASNFKK